MYLTQLTWNPHDFDFLTCANRYDPGPSLAQNILKDLDVLSRSHQSHRPDGIKTIAPSISVSSQAWRNWSIFNMGCVTDFYSVLHQLRVDRDKTWQRPTKGRLRRELNALYSMRNDEYRNQSSRSSRLACNSWKGVFVIMVKIACAERMKPCVRNSCGNDRWLNDIKLLAACTCLSSKYG